MSHSQVLYHAENGISEDMYLLEIVWPCSSISGGSAIIFPLGLLLDFTWCFSPPLIPLIKEGLLAQGARYSLDLTVGIPAYLVILLVAQWHLWFDLILTLLLYNSIFEKLWTRVRMKRPHSAASLAEPSWKTPEMDSRKGCFYSVVPEVALYCSQ